MEAKLQLRVQRYGWDLAVSRYEESWARQIGPAQIRLLELAGLSRGERVLDVACGTGLVSFPAAKVVGSQGSVVGTDISGGMIESARAEALACRMRHIRFERMDAEAIDFGDETFDAALCSLGLMYFPNPVAALRRMHGLLRPGGRAVVSVWGARNRCGWAGIFPTVDARVETDVCPMFFQFGDGDSLAGAMAAAGFDDVEVERLETTLHYRTAEEACEAAFAGGPVALAYSRFDAEVRESAEAEYVASIEPYRNGDGVRIPGEFVIGLGWKLSSS
ncbi:MAG: methyltransferase domain-containing protein [bacterium]|nr:methyltransferase domain-containing protein [bacterium]